MGKKNTLLYLDENLVGIAKRFNINISQLSEMAIKSRLSQILPKAEKKKLKNILSVDFEEHLKNLKSQGRFYQLRVAIAKVLLKDVAISFNENLNLILSQSYSKNGM